MRKNGHSSDETECSNYRGIAALPTTYIILPNILVSRLYPYVDKIIVDHQCEFRRNRSITDQIFCIRQILEKKWAYNGQCRSFITCEFHEILVGSSNQGGECMVGEAEGMRPLGRPRRRWKIILERIIEK